jgi:hypothetical protein
VHAARAPRVYACLAVPIDPTGTSPWSGPSCCQQGSNSRRARPARRTTRGVAVIQRRCSATASLGCAQIESGINWVGSFLGGAYRARVLRRCCTCRGPPEIAGRLRLVSPVQISPRPAVDVANLQRAACTPAPARERDVAVWPVSTVPLCQVGRLNSLTVTELARGCLVIVTRGLGWHSGR